jgi:hypothetical protein
MNSAGGEGGVLWGYVSVRQFANIEGSLCDMHVNCWGL